MAVEAEALEILLQLRGVPTYVGAMKEASAANKEFAATTRDAALAADEATASSKRQEAGAVLMSKALKVSGLALGAALVEGVKSSINFRQEMEKIHTLAGTSQQEVDKLKKSVLGLAESGEVRYGPQQLAEGLYHLESIGLRGAQAMNALKVSAQAAALENSSLEDATTALGAAWTVGIKGAGDFTHTMGVLTATAGAGNLRMSELIGALRSGILPVAKLSRQNIADVGGAVATLADSGYSASSGMAQLGTAMHFLNDPSTKAKKALESMGLTQRDLYRELEGPKGLRGALELLKTHLETVGGPAEQAEKIGEILPGGRGKVLLTLMEELERFHIKTDQIMRQTDTIPQRIKANMEQPAQKIAAAWAGFQAVLIRFGEAVEGPFEVAAILLIHVLGEILKLILALTLNGKLLAPVILTLAAAWLTYRGAVVAAAVAQWAYNAAETAAIAGLYALDVAVAIATGDWIALDAAMDANPIGALILLFTALALAVYHFRHEIAEAAKAVGNFLGKSGFSVGNMLMLTNPFTAPIGIGKIGAGLIGKAFGHAEGGTMPFSGLTTINERAAGEQIWLPQGSTIAPSPAGSLSQPRSHTPTPAPTQQQPIFNIEAYLMLPQGSGRGLYKLMTKEAAISQARS